MSLDTVMSTTATLDAARLAFERRDYAAALAGADRVLQGDSHAVRAWRLKLAALRKSGDAARAEAVSSEAVQMFPDADWPLSEHAQAAAARGDIAEALARFATLRSRFERSAAGYVGAIRLARQTAQHALAETLLAEGLRRLPGNEQLAVLRPGPSPARLADTPAPAVQADPEAALAEIQAIARREHRRKVNRALALAMFDTLHQTYPDYAPGYAAHIECLLQTDRAAEAAELARQARARFPDHLGVGLATVKALSGAGDCDGALSQIAVLNARFPRTPALHAVHVHVLIDSGQDEAAEGLAERAVATWPQEPVVWREYARIATRRGDWAVALERWQEAQRHRPADKSIARQVEVAQAQLCIEAPAESAPSVYDRFESLGGEPLGCEFGMVQREGGSDTVGLLRWAAISHDNLIKALDGDLDGFGSPDQTKLTEITEYYGLRDTRYGLFTHTFVKRADAPHDKMLVQSCRRMRFLAGKLREELNAGEKIFVYKSATDLSDDEMRKLHEALARRGSKMLLCLQVATPARAAGTVRTVRPNLFVGHVGFFMTGEPNRPGGRFDTASYDAICTRVAQLTSNAARLV